MLIQRRPSLIPFLTVVAVTILTAVQQTTIYAIEFPGSDENWRKRGSEDGCVTVPRLKNASIKVRGQRVRMPKNRQNNLGHLNVFVIPHSHIDAGWLETFEEYYNSSEKKERNSYAGLPHPDIPASATTRRSSTYLHQMVRDIMFNMVNALVKYPALRFILSDVIYIERWWRDANETYRQHLRNLVAEGRLEIASGSWVMTDEASPYFWSSIENLIVGQQWVHRFLNVTPKISWSVDPFGHGLMMPYLFRISGIQNMIIGRTNAAVKREMKRNHQLRFRWAQTWDPGLRFAPFVSMLPNAYYTTNDACGVDGHVCCQFDVAKTARSICSERARVDTVRQIVKFANRMASQYRSLQQLYQSNVVMAAVGDDFMYSQPEDFDEVHRIYSTLFHYINSHPEEFSMKVQFGTLSDFFGALNDSQKAPVLTGDFFPYMDDADPIYPHWSGFYNHRAYFKRFERVVQAKLRSLDLMSVAVRTPPMDSVEMARRALALSQHHDAITGTSTRRVMDDYLFRLRSALHTILAGQRKIIKRGTSDDTFFTIYVNQSSDAQGTFLFQKLLTFNDNIKRFRIQIFNQKGSQTEELISFYASTPTVSVQQKGKRIVAQAVPHDGNFHEISFFVKLEPFSSTIVSLNLENSQPPETVITRHVAITDYHDRPEIHFRHGKVSLKNQFFILKWSLLRDKWNQILFRDGSLRMNFVLEFKKIEDFGGAYTVKTRNGRPVKKDVGSDTDKFPLVFVVRGPLYSSVWQQLAPEVTYRVTVLKSTDASAWAPQIDVYTDVRSQPGHTFLMDLQTSIRSRRYFYTDVNGLYLIKRKYDNKLPFEGNIYPMPTEAMIEDDNVRCTILTAQPTGVTAKRGKLTLMVDREMQTNDGKGLDFMEASESYPAQLKYRLVFETKPNSGSHWRASHEDTIYHSKLVHQNLEQLLYEPEMFVSSVSTWSAEDERTIPALSPLPDNMQLISARFISPTQILILIRRLPYDCTVEARLKGSSDQDLIRQFLESFNGTIYESNLTGTQLGNPITPASMEHLERPLHIVPFVVQLP